MLGGLASGQVIVWRLQPADLGQVKNVQKSDGEEGAEVSKIPRITHKIVSIVDESHRKPVMAICWLPARILVEGKRGKTTDKQPDGPARFFATIAGDGQFLIWDFQAMLEAFDEGETDYQWRPGKAMLEAFDEGETDYQWRPGKDLTRETLMELTHDLPPIFSVFIVYITPISPQSTVSSCSARTLVRRWAAFTPSIVTGRLGTRT